MILNRVHFGHRVGSLNKHMSPYIYGIRSSQCIFDLNKTAKSLKLALNFAAHIAFRGGIILFFNRNSLNSHIVDENAKEINQSSHTRFWRGGVFTNANIQFGSVIRLPDLCIFMNTQNNVLCQHSAVKDAAKMGIPTIGIIDSNCDPSLVTYPIPGNDDTAISIEYYCNLFKEAIIRGNSKRKEYKNKYIK